jgi:N-acetylmuramoyl-L-alanine amidase
MTDISPRLHRVPVLAAVLCVLGLAAWPVPAAAQTAGTLYERAQAREASARDGAPSAATLRSVATSYENIVRRYPTSGYCDNALWQAAGVMTLAWETSGATADREKAEKYLRWLRDEYPHSSLVRQVPAQLTRLSETAAPTRAAASSASSTGPSATDARGGTALVRSVSRTALPKGDRITIELTREVPYDGERLDGPDRLFFDFTGSQPADDLGEAVGDLRGALVREFRVGRHPDSVTRVVLELQGQPRHSAFLLYNPFRLVSDLESDTLPATVVAAPPATVPSPPSTTPTASTPVSLPLPELGRPDPPASTSRGDYSLARQLGLGVSRIVIDAGHGGHDPGAQANGVVESELVLDVSKRLQRLLSAHAGVEVVLTRSDDTFVPLEQRTAIANREHADMFLSIHANASRQTATRGIETYILNFATNEEAEAVAARENATSARSMGMLPEIVKTIALNDKLAESRELATMVQTALVRSLRTKSTAIRDLGVKQAPFVVLIGADMPSVLAEISFLTNRAEAALLKDDDYRQRIAQALHDAVMKYQASLKKITTVVSKDESR